MEEAEARKCFWVIDDKGLLGAGRAQFTGAQAQWVRNELADGLGLQQTIEAVKPTVLIGVTGVGGLFTEPAVRAMAKHCPRPIIFPLSNPTDHAECTAKQAFEWTNGTCIFASGSPFPPVTLNGKTYYPNQSNNMFVFPGIGLGATSIHASMISPKMLHTASTALAAQVRDEDLKASGKHKAMCEMSVDLCFSCMCGHRFGL
jgi:malate dehydrogenase (oxaloacetate-decarboxylating)(NADP+)